tara:strand:+ start:744 stop:1238 length:495 start_codon:yes stop_codon:yes gene_type:complete
MALTKLNSASVIERLPTGSVIQTVFHTWNDTATVTGSSYEDVNGSSFNFTPTLASSSLIIQCNISSYLSRSATTMGSGYKVQVDGTDVQPYATNNYTDYFSMSGSGTIIKSFTFVNKYNNTNTNAKAIKLVHNVFADTTGSSGLGGVNDGGNFYSNFLVKEIKG